MVWHFHGKRQWPIAPALRHFTKMESIGAKPFFLPPYKPDRDLIEQAFARSRLSCARRCPDISLAREKLEWEPKVALEAGLGRTIAHF